MNVVVSTVQVELRPPHPGDLAALTDISPLSFLLVPFPPILLAVLQIMFILRTHPATHC